ncbi:chorismate synthase [Auriculariales sp. MPI-PUGE-AT-0066]|nr:chorismate synthase [Auriculariales sp. MPI-PUGE-AT-0066]
MSTFGTLFRVTTYGESHCASVGAIIDGCPPGLELSAADIQVQMSRRRPGQSNLTTPRNEKDMIQLQSGLEHGVTLGTPIGLLVRNEDQRPHDYTETDLYPRPSHADWTYLEKYGVKASSGGGRSSARARPLARRVAAGTIAEKYLKTAYGIEIVAFVTSVGKISVPSAPLPTARGDAVDDGDDTAEDALTPDFRNLLNSVTREEVDKFPTRCPHAETSERMTKVPSSRRARLRQVRGEACDAMLSIPATKAFEVGSVSAARKCQARSTTTCLFAKRMAAGTATNWSGGIQGASRMGEAIYFRVGFKSPATISQVQETAKLRWYACTLATRGRHDPCVVPRAVPIVEAMAALVVMDLLPPVTTLPPTMVMPPPQVTVKLIAEEKNGGGSALTGAVVDV